VEYLSLISNQTDMSTDKTLAQLLNELTPAEREAVAQSTISDWTNALGELVKERSFWAGMGEAFLNGMVRGLQDYADGRD
jgi:hypothetical protein